MFKNTFQSGFLSIFYSIGNEPLQLWSEHITQADSKETTSAEETSQVISKAHISRVADEHISSLTLEILSSNLADTYISCPPRPDRTLGIKLPYLVLLLKNLNRYFSFEVEIMDDMGIKRRFRASNFQGSTRVKPYITTMPMRLDPGWNQVTFNLADFTKRAYGTQYVETLRVTIHANCRLRRVYFTDKLYGEDELPPEFKLFLPVENA
ncbi:hypothetical protein K450DRAFT_240220 [Umbelopsis ramanniana AG]|uniref:CFA20 domain-containing protein n=1 Tax=Umbelopsis ramanniana AG TaxID=1314678 RepID=A0AAD5EAJ8_UMBRA|nr:uncharacterized protein K450DRAFT_240220 [Umbelopsis ramanniana AG]KAI8579762.1 hypothetical protein K450DRAFT_240220 [Umbelopsis ramanniana AG]